MKTFSKGLIEFFQDIAHIDIEAHLSEHVDIVQIAKNDELNGIMKKMWGNYGRILAEYPFIPSFRKRKLENYLKIEGLENLEKLKKKGEPVVFVSGHFNNFELMAMIIEREGIDLCAIYRPLNNKFLNIIMEYLRKKYICK